MFDEMMNTQAGGDPDAQVTAAGESQLEKSEPAAGAQESPGAGSLGTAADAAEEGTAAGEGATVEAQAVEADPPGAAPAAETAADDEGSGEKERSADEAELARGRLAAARLGDALLRGALEAAGIPKGRIDRAVRLIDSGNIDPVADDAAESYAKAARELVMEFPEFVASGTTGSAGEHPRRQDNPEADAAARFRSGMNW